MKKLFVDVDIHIKEQIGIKLLAAFKTISFFRVWSGNIGGDLQFSQLWVV